MAPQQALSFGLKPAKAAGLSSESGPPKLARPLAAFGGGDDSDDDISTPASVNEQIITDFDDSAPSLPSRSSKKKSTAPKSPPRLKSKLNPTSQYGDLFSALTSRQYAEKAEAVDPTVYDYDTVYDTLQAAKRQRSEAAANADSARSSRYMADVTKAAAQRERDRSLAELKKTQREREAEGDEFVGKEAFVTEAYKKKQEADRLAEVEEKAKEERERKANKLGGMMGFRKQLLEREDRRHEDVLAAEEEAKRRRKEGVVAGGDERTEGDEVGEENREKKEAELAQEMNAHGAKVDINEDGQVVDKRDLYRGGLNVGAKKKSLSTNQNNTTNSASDGMHGKSQGIFNAGGKQGMRERQTRMAEAQLEQVHKRAREEEDAERQKQEEAAKSRKTTGDISSAKERYLARKRAAAEEAKNGDAEV